MIPTEFGCPWCHGNLKYICDGNSFDINSSHYVCEECHVYIRKDNYHIYGDKL